MITTSDKHTLYPDKQWRLAYIPRDIDRLYKWKVKTTRVLDSRYYYSFGSNLAVF